MNSAPQVQTVEMSDAELDNISGGLSPHASVIAGPTAVSDSDVLAQVDAVKSEVMGAASQYHQAGVFVSF
ncbi:class IIb bacteriocin, lactobin A/cerein 7B family [Streptomyces chiangmaiensis]|uniref:Class IIb bacteriocin, lactobin A/cerein 7B family n=1 Tax=Streptomyces chiangmaiensis TaxID=766497 RepID=A0ABU7FRK9_9ACTN|nr:class IIb bacteriocin, lactobin A/cerein 7B family [Streptomyces chiangmaiensis]MED7826722.1 class IIb bacteriocin, lactobin A/cerein 7B family [Streptomyces chiangmaiensis]